MARKRSSQYVYRGAVGFTAIARRYGNNGLLPETLRSRVEKQGMSIKQALGLQAQEGIKNPDLLHPLWKLALGITA